MKRDPDFFTLDKKKPNILNKSNSIINKDKRPRLLEKIDSISSMKNTNSYSPLINILDVAVKAGELLILKTKRR